MTFLPFLLYRSKLPIRSEEHTSELQSHFNLVCRLLLEKKKKIYITYIIKYNTYVIVCRCCIRCVLCLCCSDVFLLRVLSHASSFVFFFVFFFFNDPATTEIYTFSLRRSSD